MEAAHERLDRVRTRIGAAAARAGRDPRAITLVAVSKNVDVGAVRALRAAGQADFGENRAQELQQKVAALAESRVRWHFVGRLQRNKVKEVVGVATLIHSVDRVELGEAIGDRAGRRNLVQRVLVQVNVGEDPAKGGCAPEAAAGLVARLRRFEGIACVGLMTMPPLGPDVRPLFRRLRELRDRLRRRFPEVTELSMGMSRDFDVAVEEGATMVRVGQALFGQRPGGTGASPRQESSTIAHRGA